MSLEQVQFQVNIPQVLQLKYDEPKPCRNGSSMLSFDDGRVIFLEEPEAAEFARLGARKGDAVEFARQAVMKGKRIAKTQMSFRRVTSEPAPAQAAKPEARVAQQVVSVRDNGQSNMPAPASGNGNNGNGHRPATKLEDALKTVIAAVHASQEYAKEIGFAMPAFAAEDLRTMANTLMIEGRNGGAPWQGR